MKRKTINIVMCIDEFVVIFKSFDPRETKTAKHC